ncbi:hypothetical protein QA597_02465 [Marinilabiliaceae bacterium ANBcel2]|nr:hypothetical protein [Marinilabiliaceae bacterium ANBcel2]
MIPDWLITYIGGGFLIIVAYVIISNTLWLLIGAKALQFLPGVDDKSAKGTIRIVLMIIMCILGTVIWFLKLLPFCIGLIRYSPISNEMSLAIQHASKIYYKFEKNLNI